MRDHENGWFNFERGVFLAAVLLFAYTAYHLLATAQPLPEEKIATSKSGSDNAQRFYGEHIAKRQIKVGVKTSRGDIFVPNDILSSWRIALKPPTEKPPKVNTPTITQGQVVTAPKTNKLPAPTTDESKPKIKEPAFPLKVVGFIELPDQPGRMSVLVAPRDKASDIRRLRVGDEWALSGETIKVMSIGSSSVTFQKPDGRLHTVDKDVLGGWKPPVSAKPTNNSEIALARPRPANRSSQPRGFGLGNQYRKRPSDAPQRMNPAPPSTTLTPTPKAGTPAPRTNPNAPEKPLTEDDVEAILKKLRSENPDLLEHLGDVY